MGVSLGWLAVALAASGPGAAPHEGGPQITYRFRTVEVKGLGWREAGLKPVAQHNSVGVWTAPDDFLDRIAGASPEAGPPAEVVGAVRKPVHVTTRKPQDFVTRVVWKGKGKAPRPVVESVREGLTATVVGRRIDQGVLAQVVVEDVDVRAVHTIVPARDALKRASAEVAAPQCPFEAMKAKEQGDASVTVTVTATMDAEARPQADAGKPGWQAGKPAECRGESACCKEAAKADGQAVRAGWTAGEGAVQIPEVGRASAAGEWLIPDGEVLVIGFGPHTVADAEGKAVVREHLAVIAAEVADDEAAAPVAFDVPPPPPPGLVPTPTTEPAPAPARVEAPKTAAALPDLPGRTLPQPIHPDGTPAPLPTVPEDEAPAAAADESSEPLPSPQSRKKAEPRDEAPAEAPKPEPKKAEAPKSEPKAIKSSFTIPALKKIRGLDSLNGLVSTGLLGSPFQGAQFLVPLKPLAVKLPFNQKLEFELVGRVVTDPEAIGQFVVGN
ncbi:MAG: hypothetical protein BGO49_06730 [Planctomycetales bacterium 71-10]|nr:MAG: hypothetical protein BGO49_06730 [Planctomycetales bacterium 71-10]